MKKFFVHMDGVEKGGFSIEELKEMKIERNTMVWFNGLEKWVKAEHVEELKPLFEIMPPKMATPPPFSSAQNFERVTPPPSTNTSNPHGHPIHPQVNYNKYWVLGFLVLCLIGLTSWYFGKNQDSQSQLTINVPQVIEKPVEKKQKRYRKVNESELEGNFILTSNGGKVNIRQFPDINSSVLYQLNRGEEVVYLDEKSSFKTNVMVNNVERNNFWFKVQAMENADAVGWVHGDFLNFPGNFPH